MFNRFISLKVSQGNLELLKPLRYHVSEEKKSNKANQMSAV